MRKRNYQPILILLTSLILGCQWEPDFIENPQPANVVGDWETIGLYYERPYTLLRFDIEGNVDIVNRYENGFIEKIEGDNFTSLAAAFTLDIDMDGPLPITFTVSEQELCARLEDPEDSSSIDIACFIRINQIDQFRTAALNFLSANTE